MPGRLALILALALLPGPRAASAQSSQPEADAAAPAHVAYVEGAATLEREGRPESAPLNMPLLSGDRLKTADGRIEVLFADGSALHLDSRSTLDIQSDDLVRLIEGRLRLNISGPARGVTYRVDSPAGSVRITQPGEYRVAILRSGENNAETQVELAVLRGSGEIFTDQGTTPVRAGERAYASAGLAPSYAYAYNSANWDGFDRWSESRRDTRLGISTQYLPSEVRAYSSTFDEEGDWRYEQSYGYVWYPRVDVSWRPYYYGRWAQYPRYGWTWIGADRFAWPTHHYGRWGFRANAWFWIPSNRWAPAYVSWAYAPGYVSWCPLGFDNRPVIAVNIFNVGPGYYSSSRAWTAIGYGHFGRDYVHRRAVDWNRFDRNQRSSFQVGRSAPVVRDVAVPRGSTPIRSAGTRLASSEGGRPARDGGAVGDRRAGPPLPRAGSQERTAAAPRYINRGDEIIRSRAGRPSAPARSSAGVPTLPDDGSRDAARPRSGYAVPRTSPAGPARRIDSPGIVTIPDGSGTDRSRAVRPADSPVYAPRSTYDGSERARIRGRAGAPPDAPVYRPQPYQPPVRTYERNDAGSSRSAQPRGADNPSRAPVREATPEARPQGPARSRAVPGSERSAPSRGTAVPRAGGRGGR